MNNFASIVPYLSFAVLLSNIVFVVILLTFMTKGTNKKLQKHWNFMEEFFGKNWLKFAFGIAATSMFGSLFLSELAEFVPCKLCWIQRIFMYPLAFIFGVALFKKTKDVVYYSLPLVIVGGLYALWHYTMQMMTDPLAPCSTVGFSVSCSEKFIAHYGFVTIPWMALSAFVYIAALLYFSKKGRGY